MTYATAANVGEDKPLDAFSKDRRRKDGLRAWCRGCCSTYAKRHYRENPMSEEQKETARARTREWISNNRERARAGAQAYRERHPEKSRARFTVTNAIHRGLLIQQPCEVCGVAEVEAHHEDYSKALEVRWLCRKHHNEADVARRRRLECEAA